MKAPMRKPKMQINDVAQVQGILEHGNILRLAMSRDDQPYVVPMNYGYEDGRIYMHTGQKGLKMDFLAANPRVCFEVSQGVEFMTAELPCKWDMSYQSVVGFGRASLVGEHDEKIAALSAIARNCGHGGALEFPPEKVRQLAVIRIDVESITGKQNPAS